MAKKGMKTRMAVIGRVVGMNGNDVVMVLQAGLRHRRSLESAIRASQDLEITFNPDVVEET